MRPAVRCDPSRSRSRVTAHARHCVGGGGSRTAVSSVELGRSRSQPPVFISKMFFPCEFIAQIISREAVPFVTEFLT